MPLNLGNDFNTALATLAGWDTTTVDASTVDVPFVNLAGDQTTIRATITANVPTADLKALLTEYAKPADTDTTTETATGAADTGDADTTDPATTDTAPAADAPTTDSTSTTS